jgi:hypothetical protein
MILYTYLYALQFTGQMNSMLAEVKAAATANGGTNGQPKNESEREDMYGKMQAYSRSIQPEDDPVNYFLYQISTINYPHFCRSAFLVNVRIAAILLRQQKQTLGT